MPDIVLIADDLTGALDSSVAFRLRGASVVVACSPKNIADAWRYGADVIAVSTNSRECTAEEARARIDGLREVLLSFDGVLMKKVDSRLKGNIATEVASLAALRVGVFACPAISRLGRRVKDGAVTGSGVETPIAIAPALGAIGTTALIPDVDTDTDLDALVAAQDADTLFVGAAGLAESLAKRFYSGTVQPATGIEAPCLLAIGSRDPVTDRQIAALQDADFIAAPNGQVPPCIPGLRTILRMTPGASDCGEAQAAAHFASGVARLVAEMRPASLLACGGETARAILRQLSIGLLQVDGECAPGVPSARALDVAQDLQIVTKSGGFGEADLLTRILPPKIYAASRETASS